MKYILNLEEPIDGLSGMSYAMTKNCYRIAEPLHTCLMYSELARLLQSAVRSGTAKQLD